MSLPLVVTVVTGALAVGVILLSAWLLSGKHDR